MNRKGFISTSVIYSFFILMIAILLSVLAMYSHNLTILKVLKNDIIDSLEGGTKVPTWVEECNDSKNAGRLNCELIANKEIYYFDENDNTSGIYNLGNSVYVYYGKNNNELWLNNSGDIGTRWKIARINSDGTIRLIQVIKDNDNLNPHKNIDVSSSLGEFNDLDNPCALTSADLFVSGFVVDDNNIFDTSISMTVYDDDTAYFSLGDNKQLDNLILKYQFKNANCYVNRWGEGKCSSKIQSESESIIIPAYFKVVTTKNASVTLKNLKDDFAGSNKCSG